MLFGDIAEDELEGDSSTSLATYGPTAVTTPSATTSPYFGPDINPSTGNYVSPGAAVLSQDATVGAAAASPSWWSGLASALSSPLGTGVGAAIENFLKGKTAAPAPAAKPASSSNTLLIVGGLGLAAVTAIVLLRRRA